MTVIMHLLIAQKLSSETRLVTLQVTYLSYLMLLHSLTNKTPVRRRYRAAGS
jgi:hypothetical protein